MFKCPICDNNSYTKVLSEIFKCDKCSVLFSDPNMFSKKTDKQTQEHKVGDVHIYPGGTGGVVSPPIKLHRR